MDDGLVYQTVKKIEAGGHKLFLIEQHMNGRLGNGEQLRNAINYLTGGHAPELTAQEWTAVYETIEITMFQPTKVGVKGVRYESTIVTGEGESLGILPSCSVSELRKYCGWMGERLLQQAATGKLVTVSATFDTENGQATWTVSKL